MTLHTGPVGVGKHAGEATYVLVDATNPGKTDLAVSLSGVFLDGGDQKVGKLELSSLRIPAGGTRTYAMVDDDQGARPNATGATIEVVSAVVLNYAEEVTIADFHQYEDGDRVVVKGYVQSTVSRRGSAIVFATFYDKQGRPMKRPSTTFGLMGGGRRGVQFVGPSGSVRGTLSVGETVF